MKKSKFLNLDTRDLIKGVIVTVASTAITGLVTVLNSGTMPTVMQLKGIGIAGLSAGLAYLLKNFFTNSNDQIKPERQ
jgi:hypothetical protein